jgi:hypothetical protein
VIFATYNTDPNDFVGSYRNQDVTPAVSTDNPVDAGPITTSLLLFGSQGECTAPINPRAATCG